MGSWVKRGMVHGITLISTQGLQNKTIPCCDSRFAGSLVVVSSAATGCCWIQAAAQPVVANTFSCLLLFALPSAAAIAASAADGLRRLADGDS